MSQFETILDTLLKIKNDLMIKAVENPTNRLMKGSLCAAKKMVRWLLVLKAKTQGFGLGFLNRKFSKRVGTAELHLLGLTF
jgi:hypothetical protein